MAFLAFPSEEACSEFQSLCFAQGWGFTILEANGGGRVFAVSDAAVDELAERSIPFTALGEDQLPEALSEQGFAYYRILRARNPEHLDFNAPLPPALHVTLSCSVYEPHLEAVRRIVGRYEPTAFRAEEVATISISVDADESEDIRPMVRVEFTMPRRHQQALMEELMESGAAGTSRETAIYIQSDPDGPPPGR